MPEVTVRVATQDQQRQIVISLDDDAYKQLERLAAMRGKSLGDIVIEALRLEQLFAERKLMLRSNSGDTPRELLAV